MRRSCSCVTGSSASASSACTSTHSTASGTRLRCSMSALRASALEKPMSVSWDKSSASGSGGVIICSRSSGSARPVAAGAAGVAPAPVRVAASATASPPLPPLAAPLPPAFRSCPSRPSSASMSPMSWLSMSMRSWGAVSGARGRLGVSCTSWSSMPRLRASSTMADRISDAVGAGTLAWGAALSSGAVSSTTSVAPAPTPAAFTEPCSSLRPAKTTLCRSGTGTLSDAAKASWSRAFRLSSVMSSATASSSAEPRSVRTVSSIAAKQLRGGWPSCGGVRSAKRASRVRRLLEELWLRCRGCHNTRTVAGVGQRDLLACEGLTKQ
mmetsp:Transcript_42268/g.126716  ORF Transcript_42268/g.126716 Transcript_42268/m.126716 type:complete len:325 (+) Transcript_42268:75-1049(+)